MAPPSSSSRFTRFFPSPTIPLLLSVVLLALIYFANDLKKLQSPLTACSEGATPSSSDPAAKPAVDLRVLLGVLTRAEMYERRALLRLAYSLQPPPSRAVVDVRFVVCRLDQGFIYRNFGFTGLVTGEISIPGLDTEEDAVLVALEAIAHGDVVVLNCTENMDGGKTYEYFSAVPRLFAGEPYDYVGKTDDDTYYRLAALADALRGKPRRDVYHGFLTPCHQSREWEYMSGMGYVVSWDVAAWISAAEEPRRDQHGPEDLVFGRWLRRGGRGKHKYTEEPRMYDYLDKEMQERVECYRHELVADTVAVHKLKDRLKWARTLRFFNATRRLKRSKMYQIDLL